MTYTLSNETAGYLEAFRLFKEAQDKVFTVAESIYGENSKITEDFDSALETAMEELFKLVRYNVEACLAVKESYKEQTVTV